MRRLSVAYSRGSFRWWGVETVGNDDQLRMYINGFVITKISGDATHMYQSDILVSRWSYKNTE